MSRIAYDPTKDRLANLARNTRWIRSLLYRLLDLFFLRSWHVRKQIRKLAKSQKVAAILDAGSGFGQYDRHLLRIFPDATVTAVDVKQDYLDDSAHYYKKFREKNRISFEKADLTEYTDTRTYDLVLCVDVLEHIHEDVHVMKNMRNVMNDGAFFVMHSPSHLAEEDAGEDEFFVDEHARAGYSKEELTEKFIQAGLQPFFISYTYGKFGHAAWVLLIKHPMLWLTRFGFKAMFVLPFYYLITLVPGLILMRLDLYKKSDEPGTGILGIALKKA